MPRNRSTSRTPLRLALACGLFGLSTLLPATVDAAKLYKWVDSEGVVHFSDTVPPEAVRREREELNKRGLTVRSVDRAKTAEELAEKARMEREEAERKRQAAVQAQQDRILLDTYSSVGDLIRTRNDRLAAIEGLIQVSSANLVRLQKELDQLLQQAATREGRGEEIPKQLRGRITDTRRQIRENREYVANKRIEQDGVRDLFDDEIERYRALTTEKSTPPLSN